MKKIIAIAITLFAFSASAQDFAGLDVSILDIAYYPNGAHRAAFADDAAGKAALTPRIRVTYSRPLVKGRTVFGDMVKYGESWRMGANESNEVIFYTPVKIGESVLAPGRYTLYCTPNEDSWTLRVHPALDGWGNFGYDESKDLATVTAPTTSVDETIEALSMAMYKGDDGAVKLKVGWANTVVEFPIELLN